MCNFIARTLDNQVKAVVEFFAAWWFIIDEHRDTILATADHCTQAFDKSTNPRNLQAGTCDNQDTGTGLDVGVHHGGDCLFVGVMLVIENDARAHAPDAVAPLADNLTSVVVISALGASGRVGLLEHIGFEVVEVATLLAYHLFNTAVQLNSDRPITLDTKRDLSCQWFHRGFNAIDILSVKSPQARLDTQSGKHLVEGGGLNIGNLLRQRPDHFVEGRGQCIILIDGSIEEKLSGSFQIVFFLQ